MNTLTMLLGLLGAICMMWAYWAFDRYYDELSMKKCGQTQGADQ